jgi:hypothetical protein
MRLVLVYNADSGVFGAVADSVHKWLAPETYACGLCYYTHGAFGMKREFKAFLEDLPVPVAFFHRDEIRTQYGETEIALPAVLWETGEGVFEVVVPAEALAVDPEAEEAGLQALMAQIEAGVRERLPGP